MVVAGMGCGAGSWGLKVKLNSLQTYTFIHIHIQGGAALAQWACFTLVAPHTVNVQRLSGGIRERVVPPYLPLWTTRIWDGRREAKGQENRKGALAQRTN